MSPAHLDPWLCRVSVPGWPLGHPPGSPFPKAHRPGDPQEQTGPGLRAARLADGCFAFDKGARGTGMALRAGGQGRSMGAWESGWPSRWFLASSLALEP